MAKPTPKFILKSHGVYSKWDEKEKSLPQLIDITTKVNAEVDIEFGYVLNVKKGRGIKLSFTVFHPKIKDNLGNVMEPFTGDVWVKNNDWDFYLGDTLWEPISDKLGDWRFVIRYENQIVADKVFEIIDEADFYVDEYSQFNALRRKKIKQKSIR